jgi:hypothetical protein
MLVTAWLESLSAAPFVHGFTIGAQPNQRKACPLRGR